MSLNAPVCFESLQFHAPLPLTHTHTPTHPPAGLASKYEFITQPFAKPSYFKVIILCFLSRMHTLIQHYVFHFRLSEQPQIPYCGGSPWEWHRSLEFGP